MIRILVIRFSSMGDVLLTAPVLRGALEANQDLHIDLVTKIGFEGYFSGIDRLKIITADTNGKHKGIRGLLRLSREIWKTSRPDKVIDLHGVIRSYILRILIANKGVPDYKINKGRREKVAYIKGKKQFILKHTAERYLEVFRKAGVEAQIINYPFGNNIKKRLKGKAESLEIGLAPFARHETKTWPLDYTFEMMSILSTKLDVKFHFYGGKEDAEKLKHKDFKTLQIMIHAGEMNPEEEIKSISELDLFVSMDSANMHLADLLGIPVISIWGGTHPDLGFRPLNQPGTNNIQTLEKLDCQPCSIFGNKPCSLVDSPYRCLTSISPEMIAAKIISSLS